MIGNVQKSESIADLAAALAKAQAQIEGASKDKTNPHFRSSYADLASVWDACRAALTGNGLAVVQATDTTSVEGVTVVTILTHASGQWIASPLYIPATKQDAQGYGSAITYARRYALAAMVGVAPDDDDGEGAVGRPRPSLPTGPAETPLIPPKLKPAPKQPEHMDSSPYAELCRVFTERKLSAAGAKQVASIALGRAVTGALKTSLTDDEMRKLLDYIAAQDLDANRDIPL